MDDIFIERSIIKISENKEKIDNNYIRTAFMTSMLKGSEDNKQIFQFIHYKPLPFNVIPERIDCTKGDIPKCGNCGAYLSPFCTVSEEFCCYKCPLCEYTNSTIHFTPISSMRTTNDRDELHKLVYDIMLPQNFTLKLGIPNVFLICIDEDLLFRDSENCTKILNHLERIKEIIPEESYYGLITFSASTTLYDLKNLRSTAFSDIDGINFNVNKFKPIQGLEFFDNLIKSVKSRINDNRNSQIKIKTTIKFASTILKDFGGKLILYSSGRYENEEDHVLSSLVETRISLNLFRAYSSMELEMMAYHTGGNYSSLEDIDALDELFQESGWDSITHLRLGKDIQIKNIYGPTSFNNTMILTHPVINPNHCYTFELEIPFSQNQNFYLQFATKYTNSKGERMIRVVNGCLKYIDFPLLSFDEPSVSLHMLRQRLFDKEKTFNSSCNYINKTFRNNLSVLHLLLYHGVHRDRTFVQSLSVEQFSLSAFCFQLAIAGREFLISFQLHRILIHPKMNEQEVNAFREAIKCLWIKDLVLTFVSDSSLIKDIVPDDATARSWFQTL